jgi:hypothetical protein
MPRKSANSGKKKNLTKPPLCKQNSKPELDEPKSEVIRILDYFPVSPWIAATAQWASIIIQVSKL